MPKLIFKHIKPNKDIPWVLPVAPYHLNCTDPEDTACVVEGMSAIEDEVNPAYPGYSGKEVQVISDTEIKVIYNFDTIANRNVARSLISFHIRCQGITTKNISHDVSDLQTSVILSIID